MYDDDQAVDLDFRYPQAHARFKAFASEINAALRSERSDLIPKIEERMFAYLKSEMRRHNMKESESEYLVKNLKNELIRIYVCNGRHKDAVRVGQSISLTGSIDKACLNRESVVHQIVGRVHLEAGELREAILELRLAFDLSIALLRQLRMSSGGSREASTGF